MNEKRYQIGEALLNRVIVACSMVVMAYHRMARLFAGPLPADLRKIADEADSVKEELKREMRRQDGKE